MNGFLIGQVSSFRDLDRVDLADDIRNRDIGRRQLLSVPLLPVNPLNRQLISLFSESPLARAADVRERILADLTTLTSRDALVEQGLQTSNDAGFSLAAVAHEN